MYYYCNVLSSKFTSYILTTKISDHFPVVVNLTLKKASSKPKSITSRNYSLNNVENFKRALGAETWENLYTCTDTQESYNIFSSKFYELFDLFFPLYTVKFNKNIHYKEKWFSQGLAVSRREKNRLDNIAAKCPTPANIKKFKDFRNLYNKITKAAKNVILKTNLVKIKVI